MTEHVLDRPVWSSLTTLHAQFAMGKGGARRFQTDVSPLGGLGDDSDASLADFADLIAETGSAFTGQSTPPRCPPGAYAVIRQEGMQMMGEDPVDDGEDDPAIELLDEGDADDMMALATLTKPGPFAKRTHLLGRYWGVRANGKLIAMAGERMRQPGFTEVSGVCTHPNFRGRGLGSRLCRHVQRHIQKEGNIPYLHVFSTNGAAISIYESLGFRPRITLHTALFESDARQN